MRTKQSMRGHKLILLFVFLILHLQNCKKGRSANAPLPPIDSNVVTPTILPEGTYEIGQYNTQRIITLASESVEDSIYTQQVWKYNESPSQFWHVTNVGNDLYRISNAYSGKVLEAPHGILKEGQQLWQWRYNGGEAQLWKIQSIGNGLYTVINKATGLCVNLEDGSNSNGAKITQRVSAKTPDQSWQFTQVISTYVDVDAVNFFRRTSGWIASDGTASAILNDGRVIWLMGDSNIDDYDSVKQKMTCLFQVRNSALLQPANHSWDWHQTTTLIDNPFSGFRSYFKKEPDDNFWMWPGCAFQVAGNDTIYVYNQPFKRSSQNSFGWANDSNAVLAKVSSGDMKVITYSSLPEFNDINFGQGFSTENDGYVYAFGSRQTFIYSNVYVARFPANDPNGTWNYWTTNGWNTDITKVTAIAEGASNGVAVTKVNNKYLCFSSEFSVGCDQGSHIYVSVSNNVNGPFTTRKEIYTIPDKLKGHYPFFYGVNVHPEFNGNNEILVTYDINGYGDCVNTCENGWSDPDTYRPKAIRIPFSLIDAGL